ncbi:MAG: hypothetical protein GY786_14535 [Proteobacteria bacterium]|nr:hypothetical protein [Pseudomonadota bacterium]
MVENNQHNQETLAAHIKEYLTKENSLEEIHQGAIQQGIDESLWEAAVCLLSAEQQEVKPKKKKWIVFVILFFIICLIGYLSYGFYVMTKLSLFQYGEIRGMDFLSYIISSPLTKYDKTAIYYGREKELMPSYDLGFLYREISQQSDQKIYPYNFNYSTDYGVAFTYLLENSAEDGLRERQLGAVNAVITKENGLVSSLIEIKNYEQERGYVKQQNWNLILKTVKRETQKYQKVDRVRLWKTMKGKFNDVERFALQINKEEMILLDEEGNLLSKEKIEQLDNRIEALVEKNKSSDEFNSYVISAKRPDFYVDGIEIDYEIDKSYREISEMDWKVKICRKGKKEEDSVSGIIRATHGEGSDLYESKRSFEVYLGDDGCGYFKERIWTDGLKNNMNYSFQVMLNPLFEIQESSYKNNAKIFDVYCENYKCDVGAGGGSGEASNEEQRNAKAAENFYVRDIGMRPPEKFDDNNHLFKISLCREKGNSNLKAYLGVVVRGVDEEVLLDEVIVYEHREDDDEVCGALVLTSSEINITESGAYLIQIAVNPEDDYLEKGSDMFEEMVVVRMNLSEALRCEDSDGGKNSGERGITRGIFGYSSGAPKNCQEVTDVDGRELVLCPITGAFGSKREDIERTRATKVAIADKCYVDTGGKHYVKEWGCRHGYVASEVIIPCASSCSRGACDE